MIYLEAPKDFSPRFEVVGCFCELDGCILLLKRQDHKSEGGKWGMPAGKIDEGETPVQAIQRELHEETGIKVVDKDLRRLYKTYVRFPDYDFIYHIFLTILDAPKEVTIQPKEHTDKTWATPGEALRLDFVPDLDSCINLHYFAE